MDRMRTWWLALVCAAACSSSSSSVAPSELDTFVREQYCDYLVRCGLIADQAECMAAHLGFGEGQDDSLEAAVSMGIIEWNGADVAACYSQYFPRTCKTPVGILGAFNATDACYTGYHGTLAAGATCAFDEECASGVCNVPTCDQACCAGTCADTTGMPSGPLHTGDTCKFTSTSGGITETRIYSCVGGVCDASGVCVPFTPLGGACDDSSTCIAGTACMGSVCTALPDEGQACDPDVGCLYVNEACSAANVCVKLGTRGAPCTTSADCTPYYQCSNGTCADKAHVGDPCTSDSDCVDRGFCDTSTMTCVAPQDDGATCSPTGRDQCASGNCDPTSTQCEDQPTCI
jgi:hypothetical protein